MGIAALPRRMAAHWVIFSKYGTPSIQGEKWDRVTPGQTEDMEINGRNSMKEFDDKELVRFEMWKTKIAVSWTNMIPSPRKPLVDS